MKAIRIQLLLSLMMTAGAQANTSLTISTITSFPTGGPCWDDVLIGSFPSVNTNFTLTQVTGTGVLNSAESVVVDNVRGHDYNRYAYALDLTGMGTAANHCIKLLIHFGTPLTCSSEVLLLNGSGTVSATSATLAPFGDITFVFGSGCLNPGQKALNIEMLSDASPVTGRVTIIDDWVDPANGTTNETRVNVTAIVPNVPPDWIFPPFPIPFPIFQGYFGCNAVPQSGIFNFAAQLVNNVSNGLAVSHSVTQSVQVVNGLFTTPLPFDPGTFSGQPTWLSLSVQPPSGGNFAPLGPPLPITPTPQALYAYSAGVAGSLAPGQAVTSLNGFSDAVVLVAGQGIQFNTGSNSITISAVSPSDRNIKADVAPVQAQDILTRLAGLPIRSWRYTNELGGIRHVGPMAQDFQAAFHLGEDDRTIGFVDEGGVALAAIQGLNHEVEVRSEKLEGRSEMAEERIQKLETENAELKARLEKLERLINSKEGDTK
jgi:hypothetical protein